MTILNQRTISPLITSSGQPLFNEIDQIAEQGCKAVINLAMPTSPNAFPEEGFEVIERGMSYFHIPVPFEAPNEWHLQQFFTLMTLLKDEKIWVHCALNYRASAFLYRYYREVLKVSEHEAQAVRLPEWEPDEVWQAFMTAKT